MTERATAAAGSVLCVVGARPNFVKVAPIWRALGAHVPALAATLVHTGQHYDTEMNDRLFEDLGLPAPQVNLGVGSGSHAVQTAEVMRRFEPVLDAESPACVLVVGDVNSSLACALVAAKKNVPVVHVEAGLRSRDRRMPEEINRVLIDRLADRLYTTERAAEHNLRAEGIEPARICFCGNVMIDSLRDSLQLAQQRGVQAANPALQQLARGGPTDAYGVVTLHRPSNVDDPTQLRRWLAVLSEVAARVPLAFVLHPRTRARLEQFGLMPSPGAASLVMAPPQGYLDMIGLMAGATVVLTDSGGVQEETTALGVPCLTLRDSTERPITVEQGTNQLVGTDRAAILDAIDAILAGRGKRGQVPELWDGQASTRLVADLAQWLPRQGAALH